MVVRPNGNEIPHFGMGLAIRKGHTAAGKQGGGVFSGFILTFNDPNGTEYILTFNDPDTHEYILTTEAA